MKGHRANTVPLRIRLASGGLATFLLLFALAAIATGYTYLPGRHGGIFLTGIPSLLLVLSALAACAALVLAILDHYDRRANEATYARARRATLRLALHAVIAALATWLLDGLLRAFGYDLFPRFAGLAAGYALHAPAFAPWASHLDRMLDAGVGIGIVAGLAGIAALALGGRRSRHPRTVMALLAVCLLGIATLVLAASARALLAGEVQTGRHNQVVLLASKEPARFNAVLLSHFAIGGALLLGSVALLVVAASGLPRDGA